jgi:outer membrane immunogenic protein
VRLIHTSARAFEMKKSAAALFGLLLLSTSSAIAADMPLKAAAPIIDPGFNWTGFYIGLNVGYGWGRTSTGPATPGDAATDTLLNDASEFGGVPFGDRFNRSGVVAGGQAGYNYQSGIFVGGIEADFQYADVAGSSSKSYFLNPPVFGNNFSFALNSQQTLEWFGTIRGRVGFLATPKLLLYGTGGFAYGSSSSHDDLSLVAPGSSVGIGVNNVAFQCSTQNVTPPTVCYGGSDRKTLTGWVAGLGGEYAFARNWTVKAEYLHIDLGDQTVRVISPSPPSSPNVYFNYTVHNVTDVVRFGVNYKFDYGAAVVAKN